jgi:RND family efflux transporter MFP subunit
MNAKNLLSLVIRSWKIVLGALVVLVLIVWSTGALNEKTPPGVVEYHAGVEIPAGADTLMIKREAIPSSISVAGTVTSEDNINISARVSGVVEEISVTAGDRVKKGQALVRIDDRDVREQLAAAKAQAQRATSEFERAQKLFDQQAATQQQLTEAESAHQSARARVEQLNVALTYYNILSPIDGVITDRRIEQGDLAMPGQTLLAVYEPASMRLDAPVPVRLISRVKVGQQVNVSLDRTTEPVSGTISEIASEVDAASRTQLVKVRLAGDEVGILPGTFGRLSIELDTHEGIQVPASAVFRVGQLEMVQVVQEGRATRRMVRTGSAHSGNVEILSGLSDGETILTQPLLDR